jgi:hypothetical protein
MRWRFPELSICAGVLVLATAAFGCGGIVSSEDRGPESDSATQGRDGADDQAADGALGCNCLNAQYNQSAWPWCPREVELSSRCPKL